jgi:hypothetical protein
MDWMPGQGADWRPFTELLPGPLHPLGAGWLAAF